MSRKRSRLPICNRVISGVAAVALAAGGIVALGPAIGQDRPESILPPRFGEPSPTPRPTSAPPARPPGAGPAAPGAPASGRVPKDPSTVVVQPLPGSVPTPAPSPSELAEPEPTPTPSPTVDPEALAEYEMPLFARRSLTRVGAATEADGGLRADAFGDADGPTIERLMRRASVPLPSRWMSIILRRMLMSRLDTPEDVNGADFAAERAWLLLRMGESISARSLVQSVDNADYTPKLFEVAMNAWLASSDPVGMCPLADAGAAATREPAWTLAKPMCGALMGQDVRDALRSIRRRRVATGIDLQLAQKVIGAGPRGGQSITVDWGGVDRLTPWRFGLATATGVTVPPDMLASVGPQVAVWQALSPAVPLAQRLEVADAAASLGSLSNLALVDLYSAAADDDDAPGAATGLSRLLATAYTDRDPAARMAALRSIWGTQTPIPYARLVLTARAAVRAPFSGVKEDPTPLVAAMLSAGMDRTAARWRGAVPRGGDAWAMIQLSDPDAGRTSYGVVSGYNGGGNVELKRRFLFAGLAGLGRLSSGDVERGAAALDVPIGRENAWTRALDRAVDEGQPATVVLLAAIGMQTDHWQGVPPDALFRIVRALRDVGLDGEARMIAAEAVARG